MLKKGLTHDDTRPEVFYLNVEFYHRCLLVILGNFSKKYSVEHPWHESLFKVDLQSKSMD